MAKSRKTLLSILLIAAVVTALYWRVSHFAYLRLDDFGYTAGCPFVPTGLSAANISAAFSRICYGGIWMPVTYISYMLDVSLFGGGWGVHHSVNAALHAVNAIVVFFAIRGFLERKGGAAGQSPTALALLAALLWAVHPQRAEAVAWIASRKEELWTLWTLLGLSCWWKAFEGRKWLFVGGWVFCALACLSKPTAVCFPLLAVALEVYLGRFRFRDCSRHIPLFLMAMFTGLVAIASQTHPEGMGIIPVDDTSLHYRISNAFAAVGLYLAQMLVPYGIHFDYLSNENGWIFAVLALIAFGVLLWKARSVCREAVFCAAFFLIAILPVLGIFGSFGEHARADRFLYLPAVALAALIGALRPPRTVLAIAVVALGVAAWPIIGSYRNDYTAFARALEFDKDHWRALQHVGSEYCARMGRMDEGIELMRRSYELSPRDSTAEVLAYTLALRGNHADGEEIVRLCAKFAKNPALDRRGMIAESLGIAAMWEGRWQYAEHCLRSSIAAPQRFYSDTEAKFRLADALVGGGNPAGARSILRPLALSEDKEAKRRAFVALEKLK